jgi:hypothetical protein
VFGSRLCKVSHIFAIGDIVGQPMLAHKVVHEAQVAAEVIAGELQGNKELAAAAFNARDEGVTKLLFDDSPEAHGHGKILGSMERLRKAGNELVYRYAKQRSEPTSDKRGTKMDELHKPVQACAWAYLG